MSNIFPTDYSTKTTPDGTDVVWSSDAVTNFNLTVASIALYALTNNDTDNLSEGVTNLYYTEARVTANSTVVALGNDKADKSNVLELNNTTVYTPTLAYHPVTKDYADNMGTNINGLTEDTTPDMESNFNIEYDGTTNKKYLMSSYRATSDEITDGTSTTKFITPNQGTLIHTNLGIVASDSLKASADTVREGTTGGSSSTVKNINIGFYPKGGSIRVSFDLRSVSTGLRAQISIDGTPTGVLREETGTETAFVNYSEDFTGITEGTEISLVVTTFGIGNGEIRNFRIYYDEVSYTKDPTVILD